MSKLLSKQMATLQALIVKENYFVVEYGIVLAKYGPDMVEKINSLEVEDSMVIDICQDFWEALPDNKSIRRPPFFELCNIAEHLFNGL